MSIEDVAREAGVSTATVSYVINQTKFITEKTRQKVLKAVEKLNFYPNVHARMLASGGSNIIGLLISDISNSFFPELVKSIEAEAVEQGFNIMLFNTNYDEARAAGYVRHLIELKVAGIAFMTSELDPALIDELRRKEVRVVFNDVGVVDKHMSSIVLDYSAGIEKAVHHLVSLGHKQIAHVSGPQYIRSSVIRRDAFINAINRFLPKSGETLIFEGDFRFESGRSAANEILNLEKLPTAVIAANDMMALGAIQEFKAAGLKIPQDISIVGFDDINFTNLSEPALTTIGSSRVEMGRRTIEVLVATIKQSNQPGVEIIIPTHFIERKSTTRPRQHKLLVRH